MKTTCPQCGGAGEVDLDALLRGVVSPAPGKFHAGAPHTSREIAQTIMGRTGNQRWSVLGELVRRMPEGLTDFELGAIFGIRPTSAGARRGELQGLGLVDASDELRPSPSGNDSIVWVATRLGAQVLRWGRSL